MLSLLLAGIAPANVFAGGGGTTDELIQLRQLLSEQRRTMDTLEKRVKELEGKEKTRAKAPVPTVAAGFDRAKTKTQDVYDGGFYVRTEDGSFSLKVNGFAQARYTFFSPDEGEDNHNFDVALARLAFSGTVFDPKVAYFFQFEGSTFGNNNRISMLDWWMQYRFSPELAVKTGRFILPYSRQFYTHPGNLLFTDLSAADYAFNLQRAIGSHAGGQVGRLSYDIAATNSIRALDAGGQQNFGDEIAGLGRLELDILDSYGYLESSPTLPSAPQLSVGVAAAFNPIDEASGFQNVLPGDRTVNVTVDAGFRVGPLTLQAAGYYRNIDYQSGGSNGDDWGYYGQIGYYIVPGRWELAARVSEVMFDNPNNPGVLGDGREYTAGLNYYLYGHNVKLQLDYSFLENDPFSGSDSEDHRVRVQTQILF